MFSKLVSMELLELVWDNNSDCIKQTFMYLYNMQRHTIIFLLHFKILNTLSTFKTENPTFFPSLLRNNSLKSRIYHNVVWPERPGLCIRQTSRKFWNNRSLFEKTAHFLHSFLFPSSASFPQWDPPPFMDSRWIGWSNPRRNSLQPNKNKYNKRYSVHGNYIQLL